MCLETDWSQQCCDGTDAACCAPEQPPPQRPMDPTAIPFAAGLKRRSIYDLERRLNAYAKEIFVEQDCEVTGKPMIWYMINNRGSVNRYVRRGGGPEETRLGPAPFIETGGWLAEKRGWLIGLPNRMGHIERSG
jgi:hypothetical protein